MATGELLRFRGNFHFIFADSHDHVLRLLQDESCEAIRAEHTGVGIDDFGVQLRGYLENNTHLLALELQGNSLRADRVYPIVRGIAKKNKVLTYLDLSSNLIGNTGAKHISSMLRSNKTVTLLNLGENRITDEGVEEISQALLRNDSLTFLSLAGNRVKDDGANAIAKVLGCKQRDTLVYVDLASNRITELGVRFLADASIENFLIRMLSLRRNPVKDPFVSIQLRGIVHRNQRAQMDGVKKLVNLFNSRVTGKWNHSKLMVLGKGKAGKTSVVRSLLNLNFRKAWDSTIGASIHQASIDIHGEKGSAWKEVAGSDVDYTIKMVAPVLREEKKRGKSKTKGKDKKAAKGAKTKTKTKPWRSFFGGTKSSLRSQKGKTLDMQDTYISSIGTAYRQNSLSVSSVGRESDLEGMEFEPQSERRQSTARTFSALDVEKIVSEKQNIHHITRHAQESSLDTLNFSIWDYGGQDVFYTLHHLFLTRFGVYILCFDLSEMVKEGETESVVEDVLFWLNSVRIHAPTSPVILVGTFLDKLKSDSLSGTDNEDLRKANAALETAIGFNEFSNIVMNNTLMFYPVSNKKSVGFGKLKDTLMLTALAQPHLQQEVPISWMKTLDEILKIGRTSFMTYENVAKIALEMGATADEVDTMLELFNELGVVLHLTRSTVLRDIVITNPQWLVDKLGLLIRDKTLHQFDVETAKEAGLETEVQTLVDDGVALLDVLEFLWGKSDTKFLLEIMRETLLVAEWNFGSPGTYVVPCLLNKNEGSGKGEWRKLLEAGYQLFDDVDASTTCVLDFADSFVAPGVFQRLLCLFMNYSATIEGSKEPVAFQNKCLVWSGETVAIGLELQKDGILLQCSSEHAGILQVVLRMLNKLKEVLGKLETSWVLNYYIENDIVPHRYAKTEVRAPWFKDEASSLASQRAVLKLDALL